MSRLPSLAVSGLDGPAKDMADAITQSKRSINRPGGQFLNTEGALPGPFNAWLHSPEVGQTAQRLGEQLRFESSLPGTLRETAILTVAVHWKAHYEWSAHAKIGRREGLDEETIAALKDGLPPADETLAEIQAFTRELLQTGQVSDVTYTQTHSRLGDQATAELVMLIGYYCLVSATLNVFQIPVPDGEDPPFD